MALQIQASSIKVRLLRINILLLGVTSVAIVLVVNVAQKQLALTDAGRDAERILARHLAIHTYINKQLKPRLLEFTAPLRDREYFDPVWMSSTYAVREIDKIFQSRHGKGYYYKECAINARSPQNEADPFERKFLEQAGHNSSITTFNGVREIDGKMFFVSMVRGESMEKPCLLCHSTPEKAPGGLVRAYGPDRSFSRHENELVSAVSIRIPLSGAYAEANSFSLKLSALLLAVITMLFAVQNRILGRLVFMPLAVVGESARRIANDRRYLGEQIPLSHGREMDELATSFNVMSAELHAFINNLEEKVDEKTAELVTARKEAEEASRAKGDFLATMSHEIRTPMNAIIGINQLLQNTLLTQEQRRLVTDSSSAAESLLTIINDILDFSKIEAGKLTLEPVEFDLQDSVHEVAELLAKQAQDKGIELLVRYDASCPRKIVADPGRVRQVILNLVGNAVKFTSVGHVLVEVSSKPSTRQDHVLVRVAITDTGIGIAPEKLSLLFQKFSQADASTTRHFGGTGLGLAISRQLVELMGGQVGVNSESGKGSTFFFELDVPARPGCPCGMDCKTLPDDFRVIVVDDDEVSRRVLRQLCLSLGMSCETAESGMEALTKMRAAAEQGKPFAMGLLDMRMPIMDGGQLARNIKKDARLQSTRLVIVSAHARPDDSTLPIGMVEAVLTKPVRCSVLVSVIQRMFQRDLKTTTTTARIKPAKAVAVDGVEGKRVLVAEDNAVNQKLAARMLEKLGCRVDIAANGKEAVQMVGAINYDLVLMDCQMPELDGYQATQQIRQIVVGRHLPIVAMTANAMEGDREKCLAAGMDDYVSKPMKLDAVRGVISRWLNLQPTEQTPPLHASSN